MSSTQNLNSIFSELNFTEKEQEGFNQAIQVAKDYLRRSCVCLPLRSGIGPR